MRLLAQHIFLALVGAYLSGLVLAQDIKCSADEECYNKACCNVPEGQTVGICSYELSGSQLNLTISRMAPGLLAAVS